METKQCSKCKSDLLLSEYNYKDKGSKKLQSACKSCVSQAKKASYEKNKQHYVNKASEYEKSLKTIAREHKAKCGCAKCGEMDPVCLDFHHPNDDKEDNVCTLTRKGNKTKLLAEMDKCIVLCANCHRKLHFS